MAKKKSFTYVDGNTVRKLRPEPEREQERIRREQEERRIKNRRLVRHNLERHQKINRGYLLFLTGAVGVTCFVCAAYIRLQSSITTRMAHISSLEKEITDLKTENDITEKRINTSIDLNEIKKRAMEELGMVYASKDQIAYYDMEDTDYMTQYEDVP